MFVLNVVLVTTGSMKRYLQPIQVAQVVQLLEDGTSIRAVARMFAVSPSTVSRAWRRYQEITWGELDRAVKGHQPSSRTSICSFVRGGTGGALPESCKMTPSGLLVCMFLTKLSETDSMSARHAVVGPVLAAQHCAAWLALAREHQNWQVRHWRPVLFTDESRFTLSTCDRRERVWRRHGERYAACSIIQHDRFSGGSVIVCGGISLEGHTDFHVLDNGTLTAVRYWDEILRATVRHYAGAVGPGFLLVQDNAPASCGQSVLAVPGWRRHWCHWLALTFPRPESNWEPLGCYVQYRCIRWRQVAP